MVVYIKGWKEFPYCKDYIIIMHGRLEGFPVCILEILEKTLHVYNRLEGVSPVFQLGKYCLVLQ